MSNAHTDTDYEAWTSWLRSAGVIFDVHEGLHHGADHDGPLIPDRHDAVDLTVPGHAPVREHRNADAVIAADHATRLVARCIGDPTPGEAPLGSPRPGPALSVRGQRVLDLGCGTGVLAVLAARSGASHVTAIDVQSEAGILTRATAQANGTRVEVHIGDMFAALPENTARFDTIVANLPHKPAPRTEGTLPVAQAGGADGTVLLRSMLAAAPRHLTPEGTIVVHVHSLADIALLREMSGVGALSLLAWRKRVLQSGEYPALMPTLKARCAEGRSLLLPYDTRVAMISGVWALRLR